ncbi:MAG: bifunctional histidinol-phosphatase/imidazoleglycerol-phosphate dehydratase HisB [Pseudomonadota bacterium]
MKQRVLFIDRDGTLITEPADRQVDSLDKLELVAGVIPSLLALAAEGYRLVMVSNQDGLGTASFTVADFERPQQALLKLFASQGIEFDEVFICPHLPANGCDCRKPRAGLLTRYLAETDLDLSHSAVIGDRETDLELAETLGIKGYLLDASGPYATRWEGIQADLLSAGRQARVTRTTAETDIAVEIQLDTNGPLDVSTGLGFFDHMLEQLAKHGGFRLSLQCVGDLQIDEHHTVEDVSICLGKALREAIGNKHGIGRYGFVLPMDESEATVSIDLSGRPYCVFRGEIPRDRVGEMPTELVQHFFHSLSDALGAAIHIDVRGENAHHMIEACFKSVGRALRSALQKQGSDLPSTKGTLS